MPTTKLNNILLNGSIQVYLDGFCFCGPTEVAFFTAKDHDFSQGDWMATMIEKFFSSTPALILFDAPATYVPNSLFDSKMLEKYYEFYDRLPKGTSLTTSKDSSGMVYTIYPVNNDLISVVQHYFKDVEVYHYQQLLYDCLHTHSKQEFKKNIYIHLQSHHFEVYVFQGGNLLLSNRFPHDGADAFLYYLFFVIETLGLEQENFELNFLGEFERYQSYYEGVVLFNKKINHLFSEALHTAKQEPLPAPFFSF